jgi:glycosyltransferase involved in cell wall biosynthesis
MDITYYMPFKPPEHANPSGDLITGRELRDFLLDQGHRIELGSTLRSRWIFWKPWKMAYLWREQKRLSNILRHKPVDLWLTYHSYYKAPDLLGPACSSNLQIPYIIFQGIYSTKRRKSFKTLPGFLLNRRALCSADLVVTNKKKDRTNLLRLLPAERVHYLAPGLRPEQFRHDEQARSELREAWQTGTRPVVLSTAMLRPGVKSDGIRQVIASCAELLKSGRELLLVIVGDGQNRPGLEQEARERLGPSVLFAGRVARTELQRYYSGADLFAFPGIEESLGMVYLEAQSTGLPVVAFKDWGASEAVVDGRTGLLTPALQPELFTRAIGSLLDDPMLRSRLAVQAREHILSLHDLKRNYRYLTTLFEETIQRARKSHESS